jgi:host factor-I protein
VSLYLTSGFLLRGKVKSFDTFTVLLEDKNKKHLVYKHAIASVGVGTSEPIRIEDQ